MPIVLYPKCWRNREDCDPVHCIDGVKEEITEEQMFNLDYTPNSFICSGIAHEPELPQDAYRLCFKNDVVDEMSDNDIQDLTHLASVITMALSVDATRRVNSGSVEVPTMQGDN